MVRAWPGSPEANDGRRTAWNGRSVIGAGAADGALLTVGAGSDRGASEGAGRVYFSGATLVVRFGSSCRTAGRRRRDSLRRGRAVSLRGGYRPRRIALGGRRDRGSAGFSV